MTAALPGALLRLGPDGLPITDGTFCTGNFRCMVPSPRIRVD
jgi:hypothetical protein